MKNAIIIHIYYNDLWEDFSSKLKSLPNNYDLFITLCDNKEDITTAIKEDFPTAYIFRLPNKGLDVGPFLYILNYIFQNQLEYNAVYKIHTKKSELHRTLGFDGVGKEWRDRLINCLIGSPKRYNEINNLMSKQNYLGMCGSVHYVQTESDILWMLDLMLEIGVRGQHKVFVAGTMFVVRFSILKSVFSKIDLLKYYEEMPYGYVQDGELMHKFERLFGFIVTDSDYGILALKDLEE